MWDVLYVLITLLFFATMLYYLLGCERLGNTFESDEAAERRGAPSNRRNGGAN